MSKKKEIPMSYAISGNRIITTVDPLHEYLISSSVGQKYNTSNNWIGGVVIHAYENVDCVEAMMKFWKRWYYKDWTQVAKKSNAIQSKNKVHVLSTYRSQKKKII